MQVKMYKVSEHIIRLEHLNLQGTKCTSSFYCYTLYIDLL